MKESKMLRQGGGIQTSVIVSCDFYELCKQHHIKFAEALRVGISIILAERGIKEYDNNLNIVRLAQSYKLKAAEYAQKAADLENGNKQQ
jgi:hypothetical protein